MDTTSNIKHFTSFLAREAYPIVETTEHFITFEERDRKFVIALSEDDPNYFRLILPNFATIDGGLERDRVEAIASQVTAEVKVVKVFAVQDKVWATVEMLVESPEQTASNFARMVDLLVAAEELFTSRFQTEKDQPAGTASV